MAYRNDATERARLRKLWITEQDKPCELCGSKLKREIAHKNPYSNGGETNEGNCRVLCRLCNLAEYPFAKFLLSDKVRLRNNGDKKHGIPDRLNFTDYEKSRPRTIVAIQYDKTKQANLYKLGSNGKGKMLDGQPLDGFDYEFRSYQLVPYIPRRYHYIRPNHRSALSNPSNQNPDVVNTRLLSDASKLSYQQSQEIIGKQQKGVKREAY